jgi:hypothetical protein
VDTLNHKFTDPKSGAPLPTEAWLVISDYEDIWFFFEKSAYRAFTQFPKAGDFVNGVVLHRKLHGS